MRSTTLPVKSTISRVEPFISLELDKVLLSLGGSSTNVLVIRALEKSLGGLPCVYDQYNSCIRKGVYNRPR